MIILSERLTALTNMVTVGNRVCDVGCDHGFLSIYLVQKNISPKVYAMDVNSGPLSRAKEHIKEHELESYIETRLSDGLEAFQEGEAETLVCAGMGGRLMMKILSDSKEKAFSFQELILQPQSEIPQFRIFLQTEGYEIVKEDMVEEEGKFYLMMKAIPMKKQSSIQKQASPEDSLFAQFGEYLLVNKHPVLHNYLQFRLEAAECIKRGLNKNKNTRAKVRLAEIEQEISDIKQALAWFKK